MLWNLVTLVGRKLQLFGLFDGVICLLFGAIVGLLFLILGLGCRVGSLPHENQKENTLLPLNEVFKTDITLFF